MERELGERETEKRKGERAKWRKDEMILLGEYLL